MKKATIFLLLFILIMVFAACGGQAGTMAVRDENLVKLGKVWGFVKYTHNSFISGQLDWDRELLNLISIIYYSDAEDVNGILYDWFIGLGEDGFDLGLWHDFDLSDYLVAAAFDEEEMEEHGLLDILAEYREFMSFFTAMAEDGHDIDWQSFEALAEEMFPLMSAIIPTAADATWRPMADLSWINYEYLGSLATHLLRFDGITAMDRTTAPVSFNFGIPNFSGQNLHVDMDFSDPGYRLLGLFRLWNAMKYYFPHLDVLDVVWNDLLHDFIPKMLGGTDRLSYELTIAAMAHHLHDAHVGFSGTMFFADIFGRYAAPVQLIAVEGRLVVYETSDFGNPLVRGDVIVGVNGRDIDEITAEMRQFLSYPNDEKALAFLAHRWWGGIFPAMPHALRSHTRGMEIDILRGDVSMTLNVNGIADWVRFSPSATQSHVLLDNNIGLINSSIFGDVRSMMEDFATTYGIIIDLRQRPSGSWYLEMRQYLMEEPLPFAYLSFPSQTQLGARQDIPVNQYLPQSPYVFVFDRPVVLLMDEQTFSHPEWVIMSFRAAPNVTVMGSFSMGSNGDVASLPLPGGITMRFTSLGVYTPEGGQTHRIGLVPDIRVDRTIQGITEGRDELIEAAIRYILGD